MPLASPRVAATCTHTCSTSRRCARTTRRARAARPDVDGRARAFSSAFSSASSRVAPCAAAARLSAAHAASGDASSSTASSTPTAGGEHREAEVKVAVSQWPPPATAGGDAPTSFARVACIAVAYCTACYATLYFALSVLPALGLGPLPNASDAIGAFPRGALEFPPTSVPAALRFMDLFGTAMYAHAGTITAGTRGMDLMGCVIVGCLTAMSGGTIRQVLTGETPVFWCASPEYLATALAASALTFWLWPKIREDIRLCREMNTVLNITDALALGCFTVVGANASQRLGFGVLVGVVCGVVTSCSGGVLRDICCAQPIRIMHSQQELYAVCVAAGSMAFLLIANHVPGASVATRVAFPVAVVVILRFFAWTLGLVLPRYADKQPFGGISTRLVL